MTAGPAKGPLVLLVDDNDDNLDLYSQFLVHKGCRVATARNGQDALVQASALQPDIIVMDLSLPVLDGWAATKALKKDPQTRPIPVVALTGHALDSSRTRAFEAGADGYLTKPLLPQDLVQELNTHLKKAGKPILGEGG